MRDLVLNMKILRLKKEKLLKKKRLVFQNLELQKQNF